MARTPSQRPDAPTPTKARQILHDKEVRGHPLTAKQKGYFGAIAAMSKKGKK
jgi:hypothetical protein